MHVGEVVCSVLCVASGLVPVYVVPRAGCPGCKLSWWMQMQRAAVLLLCPCASIVRLCLALPLRAYAQLRLCALVWRQKCTAALSLALECSQLFGCLAT